MVLGLEEMEMVVTLTYIKKASLEFSHNLIYHNNVGLVVRKRKKLLTSLVVGFVHTYASVVKDYTRAILSTFTKILSI